jgi:uncharacterized protein (TIGR00297 family)
MRTWLSPAGLLSALVIGGAVGAGAGWRGLAVLFAFFVTSSLLTPGGGRRRPAQVFSNGGIAAACALLARWHPAFTLGFAGAIAAAAADTWSTEIGGRSTRPPRLITTGAPVARGVSGGITLLGTVGGVLGAGLVALIAAAVGLAAGSAAVPVLLAGTAGGLVDSILGATLQARWQCDRCGRVVEAPTCGCGGTGIHRSGIIWMTNDAVNVAATLAGATAGALPAFLPTALLP